MLDLRGKLSENLIIFILVLFAFMSILGMGMSMETKDGQMSGCPFMAGQATMCQMNVTEHITKWQQAFLGIPTKTNFLALAVALLIATLASFIKKPFSQLKKLTASTVRFLAYRRANFAKVLDPFLVAFSDGILNPKIYEPAHI
ncbi:MAG: hypothetical protein HYT46_00025 [Candidatus Vogelbacteria bacterium]|nr:hypothetical protein [Candidatus Vogelbacteria bacterium]